MITEQTTKLKTGDIVQVYGWCMLNKLEPGKYRISKIDLHLGRTVYSFTKPKGTKVIIRHYTDNVDGWVKDKPDDLNTIVRIQ